MPIGGRYGAGCPLLVDISYTVVVAHNRLFDEVSEQRVHLIGLGLEVIVACRLKLQGRDQALFQLLQIQGVGFLLHLSLALGLQIGRSRTVTVLDGPSHFGFHIPALLFILGRGLVQGVLLAGDGRILAQAAPDGNGKGKLNIFAAVVFELIPKGGCGRALIGVITRAPAGVEAQRW